MGSFLVNFHVRSKDVEAVAGGLKEQNVEAGWVSDCRNGWISVYEELASNQDDQRIVALGEALSKSANATALAFLVHDSDFYCYWLFENGALTSQFNSCPEYFGEEGEEADADANPEFLLKYIRKGSSLEELVSILETESAFAEEQLIQLAAILGIDEERVTIDFRDVDDQLDSSEIGAVFVGKEKRKSRGSGRPSILRLHRGDEDGEADESDFSEGEGFDRSSPGKRGGSGSDTTSKILQMMGLDPSGKPVDPAVQKLVNAAANNDSAEIERLLNDGTSIESQAPYQMRKQDNLQGRLLGGMGAALPVSPLMAAVANNHYEAAKLLVDHGADVNALHVMFGTSVHAAATAGNSSILRMLLESGGEAGKRNMQNQTPLQCLRYVRQMTTQTQLLSMLPKMIAEALKQQLESLTANPSSLDECERLLVEFGG